MSDTSFSIRPGRTGYLLDEALKQADEGNWANLELYVQTYDQLAPTRQNTCVVLRFSNATMEVTEYHRGLEREPHWWRKVRPAFAEE